MEIRGATVLAVRGYHTSYYIKNPLSSSNNTYFVIFKYTIWCLGASLDIISKNYKILIRDVLVLCFLYYALINVYFSFYGYAWRLAWFSLHFCLLSKFVQQCSCFREIFQGFKKLDIVNCFCLQCFNLYNKLFLIILS